MNLFFYKKYIFLSAFFLSLVVGFFRCVPIEDLLPPVIRDFTIESEYNVTETIFLNAALSDNFGIGSVQVEIKYTGGVSSLDTIIQLNSDSIRARLVSLNQYRIVKIPVDAKTGIYDFRLIVTDRKTAEGKEPNVTRIETTFAVGGDAAAPTFDSLDLKLELDENPINLSLTQLGNLSYRACRNSEIPIAGTATDNIGIKQIVAEFKIGQNTLSNFTKTVSFSPSKLEVPLAEAFINNPIKIPFEDNQESLIPNGTSINLVITVTDVSNIKLSDTITFVVNCDDKSPSLSIESLTMNPSLNLNKDSVKVKEGQKLFITRGKAIDKLESISNNNDGKLKDLFIYLNSQENDPFYSLIDIKKSDTLIASSNDSIFVPIPSNAENKDTYKMIFVVTDTAGNLPSIEEIIIDITDNDFPLINVNLGLVIPNPFSTDRNNPTPVSTDSDVYLSGRIIEDVKLSSYSIKWGIEDNEREVVGNDVDPPSNITLQDETNGLLRVPQGVSRGTIYVLIITATDTFNQTSQLKYYFEVVE